MSRLRKPRFHEWASPTGAGIVAVCFFLPWLKVSCGSKDMVLSGSGIGGIFWIIFGLAAVALVTSAAPRIRIKIALVRPVLLTSVIVSAAILLYKYISVAADPEIPFYVPASMVKFEFRPGSAGVIVGLLMVAVGALIHGKNQTTTNGRRPIQEGPEGK